MLNQHQITLIFCEIHDFCKQFDDYVKKNALPSNKPTNKRGPGQGLHFSEIMFILIAFQMVGFRNFKTFYNYFVTPIWHSYFPELPSYQRFVELIEQAAMPLALFAQLKSGNKTGIYYIDSTCLPVCLNKRIKRHKTFKEIAKLGRTSIGWFFGLKLHIVINSLGELMAFKISRGNCSDVSTATDLFHGLEGLAFGDKGYLGKKVFDELLRKGLRLITRKRKNMRPMLLSEKEKQLLNQRNLVETVIDNLKNYYQIWHTRHRSVVNAVTHLFAALCAYTIKPLKLSAFKRLALEPEMIS